METAVEPETLRAAAGALAGCSNRLSSASATFVGSALGELPEVGANAAEAARRGIVTADRAAHLLSVDVQRLAEALADLSDFYPRLDSSAVPGR